MGNLYSLRTCTLVGATAVPVTVEVDIGQGLPGFFIVGLADTAVQEARHRVRSALRSSGYRIPDAHIVVNLAPGPLRKTGSGFDLPIAVAILCATGQIRDTWVGRSLIVGELSLDGNVCPVQGLLACVRLAGQEGAELVSAPATELSGGHGVVCRALPTLGRLHTDDPWDVHPRAVASRPPSVPDFADIVGSELPLRALQIAAAGRLGVLLQGPPGAGKTMMARRLPGILPPLSDDERAETALIHSVAGLDVGPVMAGVPPFRAPHHSASAVALIGGGTNLTPGEVSLAHNGVLFLDEMNEFAPHALQALRQPLEDHEVTIVRADYRVRYPADFMLVGSANPCPCGHLGDDEHPCTCTPQQVARYAARIGGPLMDRIDLVVEVWRSDPGCVMETGSGRSSAEMLAAVMAARARRAERDAVRLRRGLEPETTGAGIVDACGLAPGVRATFERLARADHLSGRGIIRTLRVARTIADLDDAAGVGEEQLLEALMFRVREEGR